MHKNNPTKRHFKGIISRCVTALLTIALLVETLAFGVAAGAEELGAIFGGGAGSSSSSSSNGFGNFDSNLISEQLRDDILKSMKQDLLKRVEDYELKGAVSVIIAFTDNSLVEEYNKSYKDKMTYEEFKVSDAAKEFERKLEEARAPILAELESKELIGEVKHSYAHILDGVYVDTTYEDLKEICELDGITRIMVSNSYKPLEAVTNPVDVYETGIFNSGSVKYTGKGTIVAVLDTGCDYAHSAFTTHTVSDPRYSRDDIALLLPGTTANKLTPGLEPREVYYGNLTGNKIAYGYDYADKDPDIMPFENSHGTHVAGIIAGKDDVITGVAIDAQLAIMKVFSDYKEGAEDGDIIAALEDCVVLGVDAINMSLGSSCGFTYESAADEIYKNELYGRVEEAGISLVVAASNDYSSGFGGEDGNTNKTDNPDSATVGSPATYPSSLAVASVSGKKENYMLANGEQVVFFIKSFSTSAEEYDFFAMMNIKEGEKKTYEYVTVPGFGLAINYAGLDVKGKIALVQRGDITFEEKVQFAQEAGAVAVIIYNNVYGDITMTIGNHAKIPAVSIGKDEGEALAAKETGTFEFDLSNLAGPFMSGFSSWGPTPDLKLKPEITAHGGNINSAVVGGEYDELSGTSMAAPNMCGITVLIRQYVHEKYPEMSAVDARDLVNRLCMSTATIALDKKGNPYSPRKQGAGLADIRKATTTPAYLLVEGIGKTKLELGDDPLRTGVYEMEIKLVNISDAPVSYKVGNITMTESISTSDPEYVAEIAYILSNSSEYSVENGKFEDGVVTVAANQTATVKAKITLSDADKSYIDSTFENGMFVEGFLTFDNTDEKGVDLNAPFLAFYGNWGDAPIFDLDYYEVETEAHDNSIDDDDKIKADYYATTPLGTYYYDYILPLGTYLYTMDEDEYTPIPATREHAAISYFKSSISGIYGVFTGLLRGAKEMNVKIVNTDTGEVVWEMIEYNCSKSHYRGAPGPYVSRFDLPMLSEEGNDLFGYNNSHFEVTMSAKLDWNGGENISDTYSFSFYLDYEAPTVTDSTFRTEYDKAREENRYYLDVMVYDNHYAMSCRPVIIYDFVNEEDDITKTFSSLTEYPIPVYQQNKGEATKVTIELTDYLDMIKRSANPNGVTLYLDDYAMNGSICYIPFPETNSDDLEFSAPEIELDINETKDLNKFFIHTESDAAVEPDYLYTFKWESSDPSVVAIKDGKIEALKSGTATIRVTSDSWTSFTKDGVDENDHPKYKGDPIYKELTVKVSDTVKEDDPNSGKNAQIEDLFFVSYDTIYAHNTDIDHSDIGRTGSTNYFDGAYNLEFYPGEKIKLNYELKPWNLSEDRYTLTWSSSNEKVAKVDENGLVTAESEGKARITLQIKIDGKTSLLAARLSVEVKSEFIIENRTLVAYKGKGGDVVIPDDEGILYIGKYAFSHFDMDNKKDVPKDENGYYDIDLKKTPLGNNTVTSVVIPEGVEKVDKYAFWGCSALKSVVLPESCETIATSAFEKCEALVDVNFDNVKIIADFAFRNCKALTCEGIGGVASKGIYAVGAYAFEGTAIKSLELDGLSRISEGAFANCKELTTVKLGKRTRVSAAMFAGSGLTEITVYSDTIGDNAFKGCVDLETVTLEGNLTYLGKSAFHGCTSLSEVNVNGELEQIGDGAFVRCTSLEEFVLPDSKVAIGNSVFFDSALMKLVIKTNTEIVSLGTDVFGGMLKDSGLNLTIDASASSNYQLISGALYSDNRDTLIIAIPSANTEFTVPKSVKHIGNGAFAAYHKLETLKFESGSLLETIEDNAFAGCTKLHTVVLPANNVITIGEHAFDGAKVLANIDLTKVTSVGDFAFRKTALTSVALSKDGVVIGKNAFDSCAALTSLTLGNNAEIGDYAFTKTGLVTVDLAGDAVVGEGAFKSSANLESFDFADITGTLGDSAFEDCGKLTSVVAPKLTGIGNSTFMNCTEIETLTADKLVSIGKTAFAVNKTNATHANRISKLNLPKLESIGDNAFFGSDYITEINLPAIKTIGEMAFASCRRLVTANLSASLTEIADGAFYYCVSLKNFDFTNIEKIGMMAFFLTDLQKNLVLENVTYIGDRAFAESEQRHSLESVSAPKAKYIGQEAFSGCINLKKFSAPVAEHIGNYAFAATAIVEFEISGNLTKLGDNAFAQCEDFEEFFTVENGEKVYDKTFDSVMIKDGVLYVENSRGYTLYCYPAAKSDEEFTIPEGTTRIGYQAAFGNKNLKKVIFPDSLRSISDFSFFGCENLETVVFKSYYAPTLEGVPSIAKGENVTINVDNIDKFPGFDDLYKYSYEYMLEGSTYRRVFHTNFKAGVGTEGASGMTAIIPAASYGYDSLVYNAYFSISEEENSGNATGKYAIAFMNAVYNLPESVDRFDKLLVEAAINAYNALEVHSAEKTFVSTSYFEKFERVRSQYNVNVVDGMIAHLFGMYNTEYCFNQLKDVNAAYLALTDDERAAVAKPEVIDAKIEELSAAMGKTVDFSKTYAEHFPEEENNTPEPPVNNGPKTWVVVVIILASAAVAAGIAVAVYFLLKKKKNGAAPAITETVEENVSDGENSEAAPAEQEAVNVESDTENVETEAEASEEKADAKEE